MIRWLLLAALAAGAIGLLLRFLLKADPRVVAALLRFGAAGFVLLVALGLMVTGRVALGVPALAAAGGLLRHAMAHSGRARGRPGRKSRVVSDALIMELDLDSGEMSGLVLKGSREGAELKSLDEAALLDLYREFSAYPESRDLLEPYLDRRVSDWRARLNPDDGAGLGAAPGAGAMTEKEAYEILGLAPGAGEAEIRQAHRRLMKRVHPDTGGSALLAARLNEAKDFLLRRHV